MEITSEKYAEKILEVAYYNFPLVHPKETVLKIINALLLEYANSQKQKHDDAWVSVKEQMPPFNRNVVVIDSNGKIDISFVDITGQFDDFILEAGQREDENLHFTHWHFLPSPPKQ